MCRFYIGLCLFLVCLQYGLCYIEIRHSQRNQGLLLVDRTCLTCQANIDTYLCIIDKTLVHINSPLQKSWIQPR